MKKRYRNLLAAGAVSMALLFSGCSAKDTGTETRQVKETPVQVGEITKGSLTVQNAVIAKVVSDTSVDVIPKMAGELANVHVKKGDKVKKGDVLAVIDNSDQQLAVEMEKNAAKSSQGQYEQALVQKEQAETAVAMQKSV